MEQKLNIAEILKNKPSGTKLYNLLYNIDVELDTIVTTGTKTIVWCTDKIGNTDVCHRFYSEFGTIEGYPDGLQILLPSKEMRDWNKFAWKKGDVLVGVGQRIIFEKFIDENYTEFQGKYSLSTYEDRTLVVDKRCYTSYFRKLDDSVNIKNYFKEIEERLGGKLNRDTLEIEKTQPKFKDGDIVAVDLDRKIIRIFKEKKNENNICWGKYYIGFSFNNEGKLIQTFKNYTADCSSDRLATGLEKQQLFSALEKEGKVWDAEKKQIVDLKPKVKLKPFDKVVVFDELAKKWECGMFSHYSKNYEGKEVITCIGGCTYFKVLPFNEETAKLVGTTNNVEG